VSERPEPNDAALDAALALVIACMRGLWHRRMRAFDLTPPQAIALRKLLDGPMPMGSVAEVLSCDASTLTGIADRLEERRLIQRHVDPGDRRVKLLALTKAGRELVESIDGPFTTEIPGIAALSERERAELTQLLLRAFG
jgi:MarR family transcriptional regulator, organic hydroperoxide resistance regulator